MGTAPHQPPSRPTLEELLRFKRAERPAPEFWAEFDRGLRQKQLAALMKRPQGWARVRPVFVRSLRWIAPATAAVAVALVVVQMPLSTASRKTAVEVVTLPARAIPVDAVPVVAGVEPRQVETAAVQGSTTVASAAPVATQSIQAEAAPVAVAAEQSRERHLPWSTVSLSELSEGRNASLDTFASLPAMRETPRPRTSWTSRFSEVAQEITAEQSTGRVLQLTSYDLPVVAETRPVAVRDASAGYASSESNRHGIRDRDFRDMESRMGSSSRSGLAIRF